MTVLSLVLAGPLQAWGDDSRFTTRASNDAPTKSGVLGLLAAARGLRRTDPLEELTGLRFAVRIDQPGKHLRDFQTARSLDGAKTMPLSTRHYLADGRFVVGLEAEDGLLNSISEALLNPAFPLYLGRRSCPPSEPLIPRLHDQSLESFLMNEPWRASSRWKRISGRSTTGISFRIDADGGTGELDRFRTGVSTHRDVPISFNPEHRQYGWRTVHHGLLPIDLIDGTLAAATSDAGTSIEHDPMSVLE